MVCWCGGGVGKSSGGPTDTPTISEPYLALLSPRPFAQGPIPSPHPPTPSPFLPTASCNPPPGSLRRAPPPALAQDSVPGPPTHGTSLALPQNSPPRLPQGPPSGDERFTDERFFRRWTGRVGPTKESPTKFYFVSYGGACMVCWWLAPRQTKNRTKEYAKDFPANGVRGG